MLKMMNRMMTKNYFKVLVFQLFLVAAVFGQKDAQDLYNKAMKSKTVTERIDLLTQAISANPGLTRAYFALGKAYKQQGDLAEAEKHLQRALIANPGDLDNKLRLDIIFEIGVIQRALGNPDRAHDSFLAARKLTTDAKILAEIFVNLGDLNLEMEKIDNALDYYTQGKKIAPNDSRFTARIEQIREERKLYEIYLEGNKHYAMQRLPEALAAYQRLAGMNPDFKDTRTRITEIQQKLDEQQRLVSRDKSSQQYVKGVDFLENSQLINDRELIKEATPTEARPSDKVAKPATRSEPTGRELEAIYQQGMQHLNAGEWEAAIAAFGKIYATDSGFRDVARRLTESRNQLQASRQTTTKQRLYDEARSAMDQEDWSTALETLDQLLTLEPGYKDAVTLLRQAQAALDGPAQADWPQNFYEQGIRFMEQEKWPEARIALEKVVAVDSNYKNVQNLLAETTAHLKPKPSREKAAIKTPAGWKMGLSILLGTFLVGLGGLAALLWLQPRTLGEFYFKRQQLAKAAQVFEKIRQRNAGDAANNLRLAEIYFRQKREDEPAIRVYESVILNDLATPIKSEISTIVAYYYLSKGNTDSEKIEILEKVMNREINKIKATRGN